MSTTTPPSHADADDVLPLVLEHWHRILGLSTADDQSDVPFFDAGGNSIAAFRLAANLSGAGWSVEVADLFDDPTPRRLAATMAARAEEHRR